MVIRMSGSAASPGVGPELGVQGSDTIKLSKFNSTDAKTRTYNLGTDVYNRVNGNEIGVGKAPSPAAGTPANLSDWGNSSLAQYDQWNFDQTATREDTGSNLNILSDTGFSVADCKPTASFSWDNTYYASNFDAAAVRHNIYVRLCVSSGIFTNCGSGGSGGSNCGTDCRENPDMNPFDSTAEALNQDTTTFKLQTSGAATLEDNKYYVVGVEMDWADQTAGTFRQRSEVDPKALPLTYTFGPPQTRSADLGDGEGYGIVFKFPESPSCTGATIRSSSNTSDFCVACNNTPNVTRYHDGGSGGDFTNGTTWYHAVDSGCSAYCDPTTVMGNGFIVDPTDSGTAYTMSVGVIDDTNPGDCSTCFACLHYDMMVVIMKTKKEELINVYDIKVDDLIKTQSGYTKVTKVITEHIREGYYIIEGQLKITNDHPFLHNGEWITAGEYEGNKEYIKENVPTVYIETESGEYLTFGESSEWVVSGDYAKNIIK